MPIMPDARCSALMGVRMDVPAVTGVGMTLDVIHETSSVALLGLACS